MVSIAIIYRHWAVSSPSLDLLQGLNEFNFMTPAAQLRIDFHQFSFVQPQNSSTFANGILGNKKTPAGQ